MRRAALALTCTAALGAAAIAGLAATSDPAATPTGATRAVRSAGGETLTFSITHLSAPAGRVTLKLTNRATIGHNIALRGKALRPRLGRIVPTGGTSKVVATLAPGRYTYYCSIFGHEKSGMRGTLVVRAR